MKNELFNKVMECSKQFFLARDEVVESYMTTNTTKYENGYQFYIKGEYFKTEEDIKKSGILGNSSTTTDASVVQNDDFLVDPVAKKDKKDIDETSQSDDSCDDEHYLALMEKGFSEYRLIPALIVCPGSSMVQEEWHKEHSMDGHLIYSDVDFIVETAEILRDIIIMSKRIQNQELGVITNDYDDKSVTIDGFHVIFTHKDMAIISEYLKARVKIYVSQINKININFLTECLLLLQNTLTTLQLNLGANISFISMQEMITNFEDLKNKYLKNYEYICLNLVKSLYDYEEVYSNLLKSSYDYKD
ncbi:hypothetical protein AB837_00444 [bacterium AB1]|nr:hypothetical protein AB837_00444 [bacterium AB1]